MTKKEFLQELQRSLVGKLDSSKIAEHVEYYSEYIEIAVRKGEAEEEVLARLGSPRLIARSLTEVSARKLAGKAEALVFLKEKLIKTWSRLRDWFANL